MDAPSISSAGRCLTAVPVYVDNMRANFGRMVMCHIVADTEPELLAMADRIGVQRRWIQYPGTPKEHFDICLSKRAIAVKSGAKEMTGREMVNLMRKKRALAQNTLHE